MSAMLAAINAGRVMVSRVFGFKKADLGIWIISGDLICVKYLARALELKLFEPILALIKKLLATSTWRKNLTEVINANR
jgi:hypothetical protein